MKVVSITSPQIPTITDAPVPEAEDLNDEEGEKDRVYSDYLERDECQVQCYLCGLISNRPHFFDHWGQEHQGRPRCAKEYWRHEQEYWRQEDRPGCAEEMDSNNGYRFIRVAYHACYECGKTFELDENILYAHITAAHKNIAWSFYRKEYLSVRGKKRKSIGDQVETADVHLMCLDRKEYLNVRGKKRKSVVEYPDEEYDCFEPAIGDQVETADVHLMCLARCRKCGMIVLLHKVQIHLYKQHGIKLPDEPTDRIWYDIVRLTYHR